MDKRIVAKALAKYYSDKSFGPCACDVTNCRQYGCPVLWEYILSDKKYLTEILNFMRFKRIN